MSKQCMTNVKEHIKALLFCRHYAKRQLSRALAELTLNSFDCIQWECHWHGWLVVKGKDRRSYAFSIFRIALEQRRRERRLSKVPSNSASTVANVRASNQKANVFRMHLVCQVHFLHAFLHFWHVIEWFSSRTVFDAVTIFFHQNAISNHTRFRLFSMEFSGINPNQGSAMVTCS